MLRDGCAITVSSIVSILTLVFVSGWTNRPLHLIVSPPTQRGFEGFIYWGIFLVLVFSPLIIAVFFFLRQYRANARAKKSGPKTRG